MGGEKSTFLNSMSFPPGSPPHGRGKAPRQGREGRSRRITPAWAGKRRLLPILPLCTSGSPPRRRGKVSPSRLAAAGWRITPAWAGKSRTASRETIRIQDHPRVGGEKACLAAVSLALAGSPPRGRGKDVRRHSFAMVAGITPAWAGKSPASQPWSPPLWIMVIRPRP